MFMLMCLRYAKEQDATALLKAEEEWGIKCVERITKLDSGGPPDIVVCEGQVSTQVHNLRLPQHRGLLPPWQGWGSLR